MFKDIIEIKKAIQDGNEVYWKNPAYRVRRFSSGYFIYCGITNHMAKLTTDYNMKDFFTFNETEAERNTELDYLICESLNITMDELDQMPMSVVQKLREIYKGEI